MLFYSLMMLFRILLDYSYIVFVNPLYEYSGFIINLNITSYILSLFLYVITLFFVSHVIKRVSDYFFMTFVLFIIAPLTSIYGLTGWDLEPVFVTLFSFLLFVFIVRSQWVKVPLMPEIKNGSKIAISISIIFVVFLVFRYFTSGNTFNLNLTKVYDFRGDNAELSAQGIFAYLNNWTYKIFSIFLISYFLNKKNWFFVMFGVLAQVIFYGFSSHKGVLFSLLLIFGTWYWFSKSNKAYIVPLGLCWVVIFSLALFYFMGHTLIGSLLVRRVFYIPAYLTYQYFDFFNEYPKVIWSNSILSSFIYYPYSESVPLVIGTYEGSGASANNGYVSMGFAHFGYVGVFIYTVIFAYLLRIYDVLIRGVGVLWFGIVITMVPLRSALISSDLLTTLLTHGLFISMLLVLLMRDSKNYA